jgi:hypothetical protein
MESSAEFIKMIEKLAEKFGFDVKEAKAFVTEKSGHESDTSSDKVKLSPIEKARKNLKVWGEKLTANKFKDEESKSKHEEKIAKEQAKLEKLESAEAKPAPVKGKGKAKTEEAKAESKPEVTPKKGKKTEEVPKAPKKGKKEEAVEAESAKEEVKVVETKTESKPEVTPKKGKKTEEAPMAPKKGKKEEEKVEETETKSDKAEKRIKRMSPTLQKQLAEVLSRAHLEASEERKRAFLVFIEGLTDDEFKAKGLIDHMRDFAKSANDAAGPDWGGGGGGGPQFDAAPKVEAAKDERDATTVSLEDLQAIKTTATIEPVGTYWDADAGRYVKGPDADADEDCDVVSFEGKEYGVGENTGRVYLEVNDVDVFQGFIGVGKFKTMSRT